MDQAEIARLKAQAAQAKAEAARAEAEAAQAALDAALAAASATNPTDTGSPEPVASESLPEPDSVTAAANLPVGDGAMSEAEQGDDSVPDPQADTSPTTPKPSDGTAPVGADGAQLSDYARIVQEGYSLEGAMQIGVLIENEEPVPSVPITLPLAMMNRHGLVAGATGTGKTRTLQLLAEGLSANGVPVFLTDIKGDLTGLAEEGGSNEGLLARCREQGQDWVAGSFPTELFSLGGRGTGIPIRTSVTEFGPLLFARVLDLNDTQESALSLIFHWADEQGLTLVDLEDLRSVVNFLTDQGKDELKNLGGIAPATAGVILREIAVLQSEGGDVFFGEPAFDPVNFFRVENNTGIISTLELPELSQNPRLFSTFIMWLLAELFEILPEVGDVDKPKLVFFFDEAHLLFKNATKAFLDAVVQTVRLIRSKGVGIFFVTQTPKDVPDDVLAQLGSKVQHALRAHTPNDQKALRATVKTFPNSPLDLEEVLPNLGTGEALVTVLDRKGRPSPVAPTRLWAPAANMGPASEQSIAKILSSSAFVGQYDEVVDPVSASEMLNTRIAEQQAAAEQAEIEAAEEKAREARAKAAEKEAERLRKEAEKTQQRERQQTSRRKDSVMDTFLKSGARTLGREISRTFFGTRRR
ncbi:helicase HerA-like domain-containing protein [Flaviflexus massiliensis]|uniref:helicase HerA-like domain-containing protein n=1 Tax=Flaviflexus massiliensis TaxID=1522309 RepID=UPI0006D583D7|nr:helicase HerA-like domain-containing protein [Flaviflexus massiliensis]